MSNPLYRPFVAASPGESGTRPITRDARRSHRLARAIDLFFQIEEDETPTWAVSRDISLAGMFVETNSPAPFDACVVLTLMMPTQIGALQIEGVVRWMGPRGMGIQFGLMGARDLHALTELLSLPPEELQMGAHVSAIEAATIGIPRRVGATFRTDLLERQRATFRVVELLPEGVVRVVRWSGFPGDRDQEG